MKTWVKVTLGGVALIAAALAVLGGTGAYFIARHMDKRTASDADALQAIEAVKARFGPRPPLIEIADPRSGDIRINRPSDVSPVGVDTIHILNWKSDTGELMRTEIPLWLMRFSTVNIASHLDIAPAKFRLTVSDVERYGPGIVVDYGSPKAFRVLLWVD